MRFIWIVISGFVAFLAIATALFYVIIHGRDMTQQQRRATEKTVAKSKALA